LAILPTGCNSYQTSNASRATSIQ
jgi:hypothetical protein